MLISSCNCIFDKSGCDPPTISRGGLRCTLILKCSKTSNSGSETEVDGFLYQLSQPHTKDSLRCLAQADIYDTVRVRTRVCEKRWDPASDTREQGLVIAKSTKTHGITAYNGLTIFGLKLRENLYTSEHTRTPFVSVSSS